MACQRLQGPTKGDRLERPCRRPRDQCSGRLQVSLRRIGPRCRSGPTGFRSGPCQRCLGPRYRKRYNRAGQLALGGHKLRHEGRWCHLEGGSSKSGGYCLPFEPEGRVQCTTEGRGACARTLTPPMFPLALVPGGGIVPLSTGAAACSGLTTLLLCTTSLVVVRSAAKIRHDAQKLLCS